MNYTLTGHDLVHAAEEMLLQLIPAAQLRRQADDGVDDFAIRPCPSRMMS